MPYIDYDFIGFTYNGKHSIKDLKIYRTSNSNRYETNLKPNTTEKTASVDGQIGQYYFGSKIEALNITVSFSFEELTERELNELKKVFSGDGLHELIFDETPYKAYTAKVTGTAVAKHLCFEENNTRVYRGEGSIQFTCYYPYAHSRNNFGAITTAPQASIEIGRYFPVYGNEEPETIIGYTIVSNNIQIPCGIFITNTDQIIPNNMEGKDIEATLTYINEEGKRFNTLPDTDAEDKYYIASLSYNLETFSTTEPGVDGKIIITPYLTIVNDGMVAYYYTSKHCFEPSSIDNVKVLNHYTIADFPTKQQWGFTSNLPNHTIITNATSGITNYGELPVPFILTYDISGSTLDKDTTLTFGEASLTLGIAITAPNKIVWDSKVGTLTMTYSNGKQVLIPYSGEGCVSIPAGETWYANSLNNVSSSAILQYEYL